MNVRFDQPVQETLGSFPLSDMWALGLAVDADGLLVRPRTRPYSFLAECECPDDCLRDHENE